MTIADHQLDNMVTAIYIRKGIDEDSTGFRQHPLMLRSRRDSNAITDFSILTVPLPLAMKQRGSTELIEMISPVRELCKRLGDRLPAGEWNYDWYFLELLDRDETVSPICWVSPELLCRFWTTPEGRHSLRSMDTRRIGQQGPRGGNQSPMAWREWFAETWRHHVDEWTSGGHVITGPVRPWLSMLEFSDVLASPHGGGAGEQAADGPFERLWLEYAATEHPGLYWRMIPIYDAGALPRIWRAMQDVLYVTSVFNPEARSRQDARRWTALENRYVSSAERLSKTQYRSRLRDGKILAWSKHGKTVDEMAQLLIDEGYCVLDEETAARASDASKEDQALYYFPNARACVVSTRRRLRDAGLVEARRPGRPRKQGSDPTN